MDMNVILVRWRGVLESVREDDPRDVARLEKCVLPQDAFADLEQPRFVGKGGEGFQALDAVVDRGELRRAGDPRRMR